METKTKSLFEQARVVDTKATEKQLAQLWDLRIKALGSLHRITGKTKKEAEENAQRIVKAVNMHDALIDCIKSADKEIKRTGGHLSPLGIMIQQLLQQNATK